MSPRHVPLPTWFLPVSARVLGSVMEIAPTQGISSFTTVPIQEVSINYINLYPIMLNIISRWLHGNPFSTPVQRKRSRTNVGLAYQGLLTYIDVVQPVWREKVSHFFDSYYNWLLQLHDSDPLKAVKMQSASRRWLIEVIRKSPTIDNSVIKSFPDGMWDPSSNTPVNVPFWLCPMVRECKILASCLFYLFSLSRVFVLRVDPDLGPITSASTMAESNVSDQEISEALCKLGITRETFLPKYSELTANFDWEFLSSKGPNGPQTISAEADATAWRASPLFPLFRGFLRNSNLIPLLDSITSVSRGNHDFPFPVKPILAKLTYIEEWGGKLRIVAQLDYYLQMAFTPLHHCVNHFLKSLKTDGTFSHRRAAERVRVMTESKSEISAFDLSNATDRMPIIFQERVLEAIWLPQLSSAWRKLLSSIHFKVPGGSKTVTYGCGQPMGVRSSFPVFALSHHVIIQIAAARAGFTSYFDYMIVGDDLTLCDNRVAEQYIIICKSLGIPINLGKSIVHVDGALPAAELCKRTYINGWELTALNPKLLCKILQDSRLLPEFQNDLLSRQPDLEPTLFWVFVSALVKSRKRLRDLIRYNSVPTSISGLEKAVILDDASMSSTAITGTSLSKGDLTSLYSYVILTSQIRRLNALIQRSIIARLQIMRQVKGYSDVLSRHTSWLSRYVNRIIHDLDGRLASFPRLAIGGLHNHHPIVKVSESEALRIYEFLSSLVNNNTHFVVSATQSRLDSFHSKLEQLFDDNRKVVKTPQRLALKETFRLATEIGKQRQSGKLPSEIRLSTVIRIDALEETWHVSWAPGSRLSISLSNDPLSSVSRKARTNLLRAFAALNTVGFLPTYVDFKGNFTAESISEV